MQANFPNDFEHAALISLSQKWLHQLRRREIDRAGLWRTREQLAALPRSALTDGLPDDAARKAFWINCYNAGFLFLRKHVQLSPPAIFRQRRLVLAGTAFSLDDIEHGILRKHRIKWSLGWLRHPLPPRHTRGLELDRLDPRIHFALNCGARSCPPIASYSAEQIETQLEWAMHAFLESETAVDHERRTVHASRLLLWYQGDFGGSRQIKALLARVLGMPRIVSYRLRWQPYDWTPIV